MTGEGHRDLVEHGLAQNLRAAEVATRLLGLSRGQVAGAGLAVLGLSLGGQAEPLFGSFVGLLLWHFSGPMLANIALPLVVCGGFLISESLAV